MNAKYTPKTDHEVDKFIDEHCRKCTHDTEDKCESPISPTWLIDKNDKTFCSEFIKRET